MAQPYPFDPNGLATTNKIVGEQHVFNGSYGLTYQKIVPRWAPFFKNNLVVKFKNLQNQVVTLVEGTHYFLGHHFISASRSTAKPIYGTIDIIDRTMQGTISVDYQTLGGDWTLDQNEITQILANQIYNPRIISWEAVSNPPYAFPVTNHEWDIVDMKGTSDVVSAIQDLTTAVTLTSGQGLADHIADKNNPHQVTKTQVGLGFVPNYSMANSTEAKVGTNNNRFMSPLRVKEAIQEQVLNAVNAHLNNHNNPHQVTATQVGAPTLQQFNDGLATKLGKFEASVDTQKFNGLNMSQLTVQVLNGTAANTFKLNGLTLAEVIALAQSGVASDSSKFAGMDLPAFEIWLDNHIGNLTGLTITVDNTNKFDGKTYVEAKADILSGTAANSLKFAGMDLNAFTTWMKNKIESWPLLNVTVTNTQKFDNKTYAQAKADILSGIAADSNKFGGKTVSDFLTDIPVFLNNNNYIAKGSEDSDKLEGWTLQDIKDFAIANGGGGNTGDAVTLQGNTLFDIVTLARQGKSDDSALFDGLDHEEYYEFARDKLRSNTPITFDRDTSQINGDTFIEGSTIFLNIKYVGIATVWVPTSTIAKATFATVFINEDVTTTGQELCKFEIELNNGVVRYQRVSNSINRYPTEIGKTAPTFDLWIKDTSIASNTKIDSNGDTFSKAELLYLAIDSQQIKTVVHNQGIDIDPTLVVKVTNIDSRPTVVSPHTAIGSTVRMPNMLGAINSSITTLTNNYNTLNTKVTANIGNITTLQTNVTSITGNVTTIQNDITSINSSITTLNSHVSNTNNPHQVTKAQVGLGNVSNFGIATAAEATAGTSNNKFMTPLRVKEAITSAVSNIDLTNYYTKTQSDNNYYKKNQVYTKTEVDALIQQQFDDLAAYINSLL